MKALSITLKNGKKILINEDQVCTVKQTEEGLNLTMSNGESMIITSPTYEEWENDEFIRRD